ncbi:MAG TPA: pirin family protein [Tepidisphaeraceae bacterium]|jgi:redox-sensitive bicupin YhaK (pirin superfamily)|nr:pirin family protein [Tepidisphaeraceae bacterium]
MITIIPSAQRHHADHGWLSTYWHFSFSDYHDPKNLSWGDLRVFNDDVIQGGGGFGLHPHRDMEIVTYVVDGELEHQDHLGNRGVVEPGEVQVMSAGRGIMHAEYNASDTRPVHLMQLWILPRNKSNPPRWEQRKFAPQQRAGKLLPVVSAGDVPGTLAIDQDAVIYVSSLKPGEQVTHQNKGTHAYLFVIDGAVALNGKPLARGDQARVADERKLEIRAQEDAELILLDLP